MTFDDPTFDSPGRSQTIFSEHLQQQRNEARRKAQVKKNSIPAPIEEDPELAVKRCVSLWKRKHPGRPCDENDFDYLLDHFDEDDILLVIRRFPDYGNWSEEINSSRDFRDNFSEILEDVTPPEGQDSDDDEDDAF
jgi:hypothetical protein